MSGNQIVYFYLAIAAGCAFLFLVMLVLWLLKRRQYQQLKQVTLLDSVSGAFSAAGFEDSWQHSLRANAESISVISMQIPELHELRTIYSMQDYQKLLRHLVTVLGEQIGQKNPVVRTGEISFCLVIHSRKTIEISQKIEMICHALQKLSGSHLLLPQLHPVFGVYYPEKTDTAAQILEKAAAVRPLSQDDRAVRFDDPALRSQTERERELVLSLEPAIRNRELTVYYQPKVRLSDYQVVGLEALVRWRHPQKGILIPDMFLPVLERHHAVPILDRFVWEEVCRLLVRMKSEERELCPISINMSAADLMNPEAAEELYELCCQYEVDPAHIEVECKERYLMADSNAALAQIRRLREYGFRFSIDNFGADHASLVLLGKVEPDTIKLDRSFFSGGNNSRQGRTLLDTLLKQSAQLHIFTVAEGVDSRAQVQYLQQAACDSAQGFYFMKPLPADRLLNTIYENKALRPVQIEDAEKEITSAADDQNFEQNQKTSQNIILFTYWPEKDLAEFSDQFSPLLESGSIIERASSYFRASSLVYENDKKDFFALLERSCRTNGWVENTLRFYGSAKRYEWMELRLKRETHSESDRINGMLVNMAGWRNEINRWKEKASRDAMTGLYNKDYFEQNVRKSLENPNYQHAAMVFFDMDFMKQMNDTYGHMFTDDVIRYLAKQIMGIFRHTDTIARFGGDEFMAFAPSMEPEILKDRLNRLYQLFSYPYRSDNKEFHISVSIGAAFLGKDGNDFDTLLDHADCALYEAKERGRNQYVFYEPYMLGDPSDAAVAPEYSDTEWN